MKVYEVILFDADMTLFDFDRAEKEAFGTVMAANGIHCTEDDYRRYKAINQSLWDRLGRGEITKDDVQNRRFTEFIETVKGGAAGADGVRLNAAYVEALAECPYLLDGAEALCRNLKEYGYRLYLATNGISRVQRKRFEASAIYPYFEDIFVSEDAGAPKPMPAYFDYVFSKIGEDARRYTLMVGDNLETDIAGGIAAGLDTCWYNPGHQPGKPGIRPTEEADSMMHLEILLIPQFH